jgi:hypothetical protein
VTDPPGCAIHGERRGRVGHTPTQKVAHMSHKFLSRPEHRAKVSSREYLPNTQRSRVVREAPTTAAQRAALASWGEPATREIVLVSPFARCTDTMPSVPCAVVRSRAAGLQGWRIP